MNKTGECRSRVLVRHRAVATDALTQFCWIKYWAASVMLYLEPFDAVDSVPNVQAHLSAFSKPRVSYHGSDRVADRSSDSSR